MSQAGKIAIPVSENGILTINTISPDGSGNFTISAGAGITITPGVNSITVTATNSSVGTGTTVGAVTADLITVTPTDLKSFSVQCLVAGYDAVNNEMIGGELLGDGRKSTNVSIIGTPDKTSEADAGLSTASYDLVASAGTFIIRVTGVAARTIAWSARLNYVSSP